jgi:hypothetical protein
VAHLEDRIKHLSNEIREIQSKDVRERNIMRLEERKQRIVLNQEENRYKSIIEKLRSLLGVCSSDPESSQNSLRLFCEDIRVNWKQKQSQTHTHFNQLSSSLIPELHDTFIIWLLSRESEFYTNPNGLWNSLVKEMEISHEQCTALLALAESMSLHMSRMQELQSFLQSVRSSLESNQIGLNLTIDDVSDILSPLQLCKFILWVNDNHWCAQMLNSIWSAYRPFA